MGSGSGGSAISIHAPHTGRDLPPVTQDELDNIFQSTRPIRGATLCLKRGALTQPLFQSTRPIRGATALRLHQLDIVHISIHAPHTGRDVQVGQSLETSTLFQSTRPIRGATELLIWPNTSQRFQSTRPIRGATPVHGTRCENTSNFNPRAPYGARRGHRSQSIPEIRISIHAPHTGRDYAARHRYR